MMLSQRNLSARLLSGFTTNFPTLVLVLFVLPSTVYELSPRTSMYRRHPFSGNRFLSLPSELIALQVSYSKLSKLNFSRIRSNSEYIFAPNMRFVELAEFLMGFSSALASSSSWESGREKIGRESERGKR